MKLFTIATVLCAAFAQGAFAQIPVSAPNTANTVVTVMSDGLSEPASPASKVLSELSIALDEGRKVRLLTINGYGGLANVRDLLQLRGTDLAIVNNDILAYGDLAKMLPEARRKMRLVTPLVSQSVFLLAKKTIETIDGLRGKRVGIPAGRPSRGVTAKTVFAHLKIDAQVVETATAARTPAEDFDAVLVYEEDLPNVKALGITAASHHVLAIPASPLKSIYISRKLGKDAAGGFDIAEGAETIQVSTLLAAFDWSVGQARYEDVVSFVNEFFALIPKFRSDHPGSPFSETDVRVVLPGWKHFGPADSLAAAALPPAPSSKAGSRKVLSAAASSSPAETLQLLAVARPPLTDAAAGDGGVALKILTDALSQAGIAINVQWVDNEKALLDGVITQKSADAGFFWQTPYCNSPSNQSVSEAELCDSAVLSDPVMQVVIGVFTRPDTPLDPKSPEAARTRVICVPENEPVPFDALAEIAWIKAADNKFVRPKTLIDCLALVDRHEADALIAVEPESRFVIGRLKLAQSFQITQRPGMTTGLHAVVAMGNPKHVQLIETINKALADFRSSAGYSAVMESHLAALTGDPAEPR